MKGPLPDALRPKKLDEVVGQDHLCGLQGSLRRLVEQRMPTSLILWGPPGSGKTTLARVLAEAWDAMWIALSALSVGAPELRKMFEGMKRERRLQPSVVFVDEIHHFNKAQQDVFLPYVEDGTIVLIGATTENPSFELNAALLSRVQVFTLRPLTQEDLKELLRRAEKILERSLPLTSEASEHLCDLAHGDGRALLSMVETILPEKSVLGPEDVDRLLGQRRPNYDKRGEGHYNLISALHKAIRGSDVDGALYWLARMLCAGEDRHFILRRLIRCASEDIGLADPQALLQAIAAREAYNMLGDPEGELTIAQLVIYLSTAPKSNAAYIAYKKAHALAEKTSCEAPPLHSLNAPTKLMKALGYSKGYKYDHDEEDGFAGLNYFPAGLGRPQLYTPVERGFEREISKRLAYWQHLRAKKNP